MNEVFLTASLVVYNSDIIKVRQTIDTFLKQDVSCEAYLVVLDNASTNTSVFYELEKAYVKFTNVSFVKLFCNKGYGAGHNMGFIIAAEYLKSKKINKKQYHLVLNPDLILEPDCVKNMINQAEHSSDIGLCVPKIYNIDGTVQYLNKEHPTVFDLFIRRFLPKKIADKPFFKEREAYYTRQKYGYDDVVEVPFASGCCMLFKADIYRKINGFDEEYFLYMEDADISLRIGKIAKIIFVPNAKVQHYWDRATHKSIKMALRSMWSALIYFRKHGIKLS